SAVQELRNKFPGQDILVETFLPGRELTVSILGTGEDSRELEYASRRSKSSKANLLVCQDHDLTHPQIQAACIVSLDAWKLFGCRDAGRVDIRFDSNESDAVPNILEAHIFVAQVNPISGLLPVHSPLPGSAESNGISYAELLEAIIEIALRRYAPTVFVNGNS
ncbi:uncharacterized protein N7529_006644, partial [Penicillium soppii]|uniref:uncharacterized protein n=1 Tax=Penicillium soppii TaxID=69789 RepID=UPI0025468A22